MKFVKLITDADISCVISGKHTADEIIDVYLKAHIGALYDMVAAHIVDAKLSKPHLYRFRIQVHAIEKDK